MPAAFTATPGAGLVKRTQLNREKAVRKIFQIFIELVRRSGSRYQCSREDTGDDREGECGGVQLIGCHLFDLLAMRGQNRTGDSADVKTFDCR